MPPAALNPDHAERLGTIVDAGSTPEQLATGFRFVEGPSWHATEAALYFSDIIGNAQYRWHEGDGVSTFRAPSFMANGTTWDPQGRLLVCEHAGSRVSRVDLAGNYEILVSHFDGKQLNSPNDIVVKSDGCIHFTDPPYGRNATHGVLREQELDFQGVYRLDPETRELTLLVDDFAGPNGLCFSVDESRLFINDTVRQHIRVFEVAADGSLLNGRLFAETGGSEPGVADGMKFDQAGHLYCCGSGGIHVFDAEGKRLGIIRLPEPPANFTWGGADLHDLLITARQSLYRLRVKIPGHCPFVPGLTTPANKKEM
jgi:gluconolactonase